MLWKGKEKMKQSHFTGIIILMSIMLVAAGFIIQDTNRMLQDETDKSAMLAKTNKHYAGIIDNQRHEIENLKGQLGNAK